MTRFHHTANGSATTTLIERAGLPGSCSIWADPLHDGPVPAELSDRELMEVRARHLGGPWGSRVGGANAEHTVPEVMTELERWRAAIDDASAYDELVLWYEHDLFDQLNLIQVLDRIGSSTAGARRVSLVSLDSFPGRPDFRGLGELEPDDIASLFTTRQPIVEAQLTLAARAWAAFRSPNPRAIEALLLTETQPLPFLAAALSRHLRELPSTRYGLSRFELSILDLASEEPVSIWDAFHRVSNSETAFYLGDLSFWRLVESLVAGASEDALLDVRLESARGAALPRGQLSLTETGRAVLAGDVDRVAAIGIDRWLGGVHLEGRGPVWRFDDDGRRVVIQ